MGPGIFSHFLESEFLKVESRRHHEASLAKQDFDKFAELKVVETSVLLAPQSRNGGWTDFDVTIAFHREMDTEERIPQIGYRVNISAERRRGFIRVEIKSLERKDAISFRKAKIKSDLVGIEPGRVDHMICCETSLWRHNQAFLGSQIRRTGSNRYTLLLRVPDHFFDHPLRIRRCRRRRKNSALVCLDARFNLTGLLFR